MKYVIALLLCIGVKAFAFGENLVGQRDFPRAIYDAIIADSAESLRKALDDVAYEDQYGLKQRALVWAILLQKRNVADNLLHIGVAPDAIFLDKYLIEHSLVLKDLESASLLMRAGSKFKDDENKIKWYLQGLLNSSIRADSESGIKRAIYLGAQITFIDIYEAINKNKHDALKLLIENGADIKDERFVREALKHSFYDISLTLAENGALINEDIMMQAVARYSSQNMWALQFLQVAFDHGYKISGPSNMLKVWEIICTSKTIELFDFFIKNGFDVNQQIIMDDKYTTPLFIAIFRKSLWAIPLLLKAGANINHKAYPVSMPQQVIPNVLEPVTALFYAILTKSPEVIDLLLREGATLE